MPDITPVPAPADMPEPPTTLGERLAADLLTLAELAQENATIAEVLAAHLREVYVVLPGGRDLNHDDIAALVERHAAEEIPPAWVEPKWATRAWMLPAGSIQLTCTRLSPAAAAAARA